MGLILLLALASVVQAQEFKLGPFTLNPGPDDHFQRFVGKDVTVSTLNAGLIQGTMIMNYVNDFEVVGKCGKSMARPYTSPSLPSYGSTKDTLAQIEGVNRTLSNLQVLTICAHPDDYEYSASATLSKLAVNGNTIRGLVLTHGERGGNGVRRVVEARRSAAC